MNGTSPGAIMDTCIGAGSVAGIDADTRVTLREATALILRPPDHLQFGTIPGQSLVLPLPERASPAQVMLVFREARRPVTCSFLVTRLGHCGIAPAHARGILAELQRTGLLTVLPQPLPVHVTGPGAPSSTLVQALMRRGIAAEPIVPGSAAFGRLTPAGLVVLAGQLFPPPDVTYRLMERGVTHLPCAVVDGRVIVGPVVNPGVTPCLSCADIAYQELDADWRMVRAQSCTSVPATSAVSNELAATVVTGVVHEMLSAGRPFPTELPPEALSRRMFDPRTLSLESWTPMADPDCPACAGARQARGLTQV
ncbi:MAG: TOMM precursor leader peptide-binding protein [Corynebacterium sp.]|uniref:TOMM precursor leader peptide-binding protein n=1 Tax=Corynebacterium TaxID=1716 RepID=UPI0026496EB1|nr:TOMM precursor leader peptide-binding protein [Corynebacterium sp.]MDN5721817.1 TOMM precursor leader peptide-binding protein [Corynebacterium sp.]MDN6282692.1 TOMM precursor leader peptide-binding protein [Corynebacterium sp.]MDN6305367.1 TOMM precursor leader peptide-binding protein [Corynebacterium sp.]MDN6367562.1 TOMM precursor leader peptide-binding protein [Corynebacterium sp.]MDN6375137.1 TOMM precursor leader peptide-binding protein [Corynebacterium sp.]